MLWVVVTFGFVGESVFMVGPHPGKSPRNFADFVFIFSKDNPLISIDIFDSGIF